MANQPLDLTAYQPSKIDPDELVLCNSCGAAVPYETVHEGEKGWLCDDCYYLGGDLDRDDA